MATILVTGTAGFIGMHLAHRLLAGGHRVVGIDNFNDYYSVKLKRDRHATLSGHPSYTGIEGDLCDMPTLCGVFEKYHPDRVCNLAAQAGVRYSLEHPEAYQKANLEGFLNILECCRHHKTERLVYASSSSVYGGNTKLPFSESDPVDSPVSLYAATKKANELMAHCYSHLYGIQTIGLRFFTVYGPWGRPDMALFIFTKAILEGKPIEVFNHGNMERDFTYVDDIVGGISRMLSKAPVGSSLWNPENPDPASSSAPYRIYNIGNSKPVKLMDFISAIEDKIGRKAIKNLLPIQAGDVEKTWADTAQLTADFNYTPSTSISDGIDRFITWYLEYYKIKI